MKPWPPNPWIDPVASQ